MKFAQKLRKPVQTALRTWRNSRASESPTRTRTAAGVESPDGSDPSLVQGCDGRQLGGYAGHREQARHVVATAGRFLKDRVNDGKIERRKVGPVDCWTRGKGFDWRWK